MKKNILVNFNRSINKTMFKVKKHSPEILVVTGIIGVVASAVMACKATTKISKISDEHKKQIDEVHLALERGETKTGESYDVEDSKKDLTIIYAQTGLKYVKLYAPSVILGALSITAIISSNNILRKRNVALAAAYTAVDKSFKNYRNRVVERFGKDLDRELRYNIKAKEVEETIVDDDGKEKKIKKTVNVASLNEPSDYARFFDEYCTGWTKDSEYNLGFLKAQQAYANNRLREQGYLYLNDVYDMLGIPKTKAGQVVGWVYDESNKDIDNYVDFGIYDLHDEDKRDFVNGREWSILLDFNVDGNIWENMK